jgi:hypothetical protein
MRPGRIGGRWGRQAVLSPYEPESAEAALLIVLPTRLPPLPSQSLRSWTRMHDRAHSGLVEHHPNQAIVRVCPRRPSFGVPASYDAFVPVRLCSAA